MARNPMIPAWTRCGPGFAVLLFILAFSAWAQTQATKDSTGLTLLAQMEAATGWTPTTLPADATETGTITTYQGDTQSTGSITIQVKGTREISTQVNNNGSSVTVIVNNGQGAFTDENGVHAIAPQSAMSIQALDLPFLTTLMSFGAPNVAIQSQGADTVNGQATQKILISPQATTNVPFDQLCATAWTMTVWVGPSGLPVQIAYTRVADNNPTATVSRIRQYSGWQTVNGLEVPFHQEDYAGSQHVFTLQLQSVQFNTGLTDSDFVVPQVQQ